MSDWKFDQATWDKLEEIERREDAGENVWNLHGPAPIREMVKEDAATAVVVKASTGSMKDRAIAVYNTLTDKSRKAVIEALTTQLGMKAVTASTYSSNLTSGRWS